MYFVLELQEEQNGTTRALEPAVFENKEDALQKYYLILQYAVKSELAKHTAMIITTEGQTYKSECYMHTLPEPEVEEPEEPAEETPDAKLGEE